MLTLIDSISYYHVNPSQLNKGKNQHGGKQKGILWLMIVNIANPKDPWVRKIPGSGRSPGEGKDNSFQYSCLENSMDRGAWQATVHWVSQS